MDASPPPTRAGHRQRRRYAAAVAVLTALALLAGLAIGADGFAPGALAQAWHGDTGALIVGQIRAPRSLGAWCVGALLGLGGTVAQGLFRNPLADPYLLGSAAGAGLGVVALLAAAGAGGAATAWSLATLALAERLGLVGAAFAGALAGVALTLAVARGAVHTLRLLLAGVVVAALLGAVADALTLVSPEALRGKQSFLLGNTAFLGWPAVALLGGGLAAALLATRRLARALDALALGEDTAASLGVPLARVRRALVAWLSVATALAVSQAGLVAFVGLVAPHLVRRQAGGPHAWLLAAGAATGGLLLLAADLAARGLWAPQELPVGLVTAVLGGAYLLVLIGRRSGPP